MLGMDVTDLYSIGHVGLYILYRKAGPCDRSEKGHMTKSGDLVMWPIHIQTSRVL